MNLAYPYQVSPLGRTAEEPDARHVRALIEQVLFTAPGEREDPSCQGIGEGGDRGRLCFRRFQFYSEFTE